MGALLMDRPPALEGPPAVASETGWGEVVAALTRRQFLGAGVAGAALLGVGLTGTGSGVAGASGATRTVSTAKGRVRVPADPKRVVAVNPIPMATLYDLGVKVLGVYDEGVQYVSPRYRARYEAATKVGTAGQIDIEEVAALHPDLIVGANFSFNADVYAQLSAIAPTVLTPTSGTWQSVAEAAANAVNRTKGLTALERRLQQRSSQIRTTYGGVLSKYRWDVLQGGFDQGQYWLYGPGSPVGQILAGAGVRYASGSAHVKGDGNRSLSYERIDVLDGAGVIGFYAGYDGTPNNEGPALFSQPAFKALAAVRAHRLVPIPDFLPGGYGDALAVLDELEAGLKKLRGTK